MWYHAFTRPLLQCLICFNIKKIHRIYYNKIPAASCPDRISLLIRNRWFWCDCLHVWCIKCFPASDPDEWFCCGEQTPLPDTPVVWKRHKPSRSAQSHRQLRGRTVHHPQSCITTANTCKKKQKEMCYLKMAVDTETVWRRNFSAVSVSQRIERFYNYITECAFCFLTIQVRHTSFSDTQVHRTIE